MKQSIGAIIVKVALAVMGFLLIYETSVAQTPRSKYLPIYLSNLDSWFQVAKIPCRLEQIFDDSTKIDITFTSAKGACYFKKINDRKVVVQTGSYSDALDVFKRYIVRFSADGSSKLLVESYYQPLSSGNWIYYSADGALIKQEAHVQGMVKIKGKP